MVLLWNTDIIDSQNISDLLQISKKKARLDDITKQINETANWTDMKAYASLSKEKTLLTNIINEFYRYLFMEITKIGSFTEKEIEALKEAGGILGSVAKALEAGEINLLSETSKGLVEALKDVLGRIK
jgi:beta-N-acetylglucosaminidase